MDFRLLLAGSPEPLSGVMLPSSQAYSQLMAFTMTVNRRGARTPIGALRR